MCFRVSWLTSMKNALKRHVSAEATTTDGLRSYKAAMDELGNRGKQTVGRHANVYNQFSLERHIVDRQTFKERRTAALAEWQSLAI
jgi:putative transposase